MQAIDRWFIDNHPPHAITSKAVKNKAAGGRQRLLPTPVRLKAIKSPSLIIAGDRKYADRDIAFEMLSTVATTASSRGLGGL